MPENITDMRKEVDCLVTEAKAFFEEARRSGLERIDDLSCYQITGELRARSNDIRYRIRWLLARLATPIQGSPLLDKQDFRKFVRLGRAMDAALHFEPFRRVSITDEIDSPPAATVFNEASEQLAELLDLIPEQSPSPALAVPTDGSQMTSEEQSAASEQRPESETPRAPVTS